MFLRDVQYLLWLLSDIDVRLNPLFFIVSQVALQFGGSRNGTVQQYTCWEVEGVQSNLTRKHDGSANGRNKKNKLHYFIFSKIKQ